VLVNDPERGKLLRIERAEFEKALARHPELDAPCGASPPGVKVRHLVFAVVLLASVSHLGKAADEAQRLESVKRLYQQQRWEEVLREAQGTVDQSADFDYYVGMALSRLERWNEARVAFSQGCKESAARRTFSGRARRCGI